jgi:L-rhamnose mutarotase
MWEWWSFMKDIMDTNADTSPVSHNLEEVFYLE